MLGLKQMPLILSQLIVNEFSSDELFNVDKIYAIGNQMARVLQIRLARRQYF